MSQLVGGNDPVKPWERILKPIDRFSWDLNALRSIIIDQEERIKILEMKISQNHLEIEEEPIKKSTKKKATEKVINEA